MAHDADCAWRAASCCKWATVLSSQSVVQVVVLLAQIQLHMLSQQTAAAHDLLSACTSQFKEQAQQGQTPAQPLWRQLQLHFCILRVLVMLTEGRYAELIAPGNRHASDVCPA